MVIQGEEGRARPDAIKGTREGEEGDLGLPRELSNQHGDTRIPGPGAWPLLSPADASVRAASHEWTRELELTGASWGP